MGGEWGFNGENLHFVISPFLRVTLNILPPSFVFPRSLQVLCLGGPGAVGDDERIRDAPGVHRALLRGVP